MKTKEKTKEERREIKTIRKEEKWKNEITKQKQDKENNLARHEMNSWN
jgi:hypothetical protein